MPPRAEPLGAPTLTGLTCTHFAWAPLAGVSDRAAILLPGTLNGSPAVFQLDSGADANFLLGGAEAWPELPLIEGARPGSPRTARVDITLGEISNPQMLLMLMAGQQRSTEPTDPVGSLGLPYFRHKVVAIDFPHQQFCVSAALPQDLERRTTFVPAAVRGGKLMVPIEINGAVYDSFAYDTGFSVADVATDLELWLKLTGKATPDDADRTFLIQRFGATVSLNRAATTGPMRIAGVALAHGKVDVLPTSPGMYVDMGRQMGITFQGAIGNAPFLDRIVVIDMREEGAYRFGVA
jgi:hypothetical protein